MKKSAKVSVIIPVYNVSEYLPFAMQSCMDQTLYDVEFICVNDGSTDNSLEILKQYQKLDDRIIVVNKENGGVSSARNAGLKIATGEWIMFLDPDDYLSKNACERVWIESEEGPTDIINFGTEIVPKQPKAPDWYNYVLTVWTKRLYDFHPDILFKEPSTKPFIWHQAYSKNLLDKSGVRFIESLNLGEDQTFLISLYPHASKFAFIEDKLYNYRYIRNNSAMQVLRKNPFKKLKSHLDVIDYILDYWQKNKFIKKYGKDILGWSVSFIAGDLMHDLMDDKSRAIIAKNFYCLIDKKYNLTKYAIDMEDGQISEYKQIKRLMKIKSK